MTVDSNLIADNEKDLWRAAQIKAISLGRPLYIVRLPNKQYKITSYFPHSPDWKREKYEWVRTILATEK